MSKKAEDPKPVKSAQEPPQANDKELEARIRHTLLQTVQFSHTNGNNIVIEPTEATKAIMALIHKDRAAHDIERDKHALRERIDELKEIQIAPDVSDDAKDENYTGYIKDRVVELEAQLKALEGEK